MGETPL